MASEKAHLRERFQATRLALPESARAEASRALCEHVFALPEITALTSGHTQDGAAERRAVGVFWARTDYAEVDVRPLALALRRRGLATAFPRVVGPGEMTWHVVPSDAALVEGRMGLREPSHDAPRLVPADLDLFVVPGLAFGADGSRLGWGGGYYDRALARSSGVTVGVTFAAALTDTLPTDAHDVRMGIVVTERGVLRSASPPEPTA